MSLCVSLKQMGDFLAEIDFFLVKTATYFVELK